jgi:hypothetical protein
VTIQQLNNKIGGELGFVAGYLPRYKWVHSEDPEMLHPMRLTDPASFDGLKREYKANEQGIIESVPVFELRKMCHAAHDQWLLAEWLPCPSEAEWRRLFGYLLEWPRNGQYYPTNVFLDPGQEPNLALTDVVIECVREERKKSAREVEEEHTLARDKHDAEKKQQLLEEIRDLCTTYDHVPGRHDQVSYPAKQTYANNHS